MSMKSIRVNDQIAKFFSIELDNRLHLNGREKISFELSERTAAHRSLSSKANRSPLNENWNPAFRMLPLDEQNVDINSFITDEVFVCKVNSAFRAGFFLPSNVSS